MSKQNNPFATILIDKEKNNAITTGIDAEIRSFEGRILRVKNEISNIEGLIEINTFYSDKETDRFLWVD